ncbi:hypothetical protein [Streptomyces purpureus]|uniref:Lipoprotein n=1 Tax=Streptomyces purpureus TaxID=1951 RepID=A0A918GZY3_9ACTN|nr:hypothetical protein [Streptomyces purpureus]GGT23934.1 hypothetical protein GCM10014713_16160 [Streptomyces purpureus]
MKKTSRLCAVTAAVALFALTACSGPGSSGGGEAGKPYISADYAQYASAEEVSTVADIAITAAVLSVQTKECDDGGDPAGSVTVDPTAADDVDTNPDPSAPAEPEPTAPPSGVAGDGPASNCMPMVFMKVRVSGMMKRGFGVTEGDEIIIGNIDTDAVNMEGTTPLVVGKQYALYLTQLVAADHPGITSVPTFWIPVGGNQGIFTVGKGGVQPASANIVALTSAEAETKLKQQGTGHAHKGTFTTTVEGLKKAAALSASAAATKPARGPGKASAKPSATASAGR